MKKVYRLFGVPVWSVETKHDKTGERYTAKVQLTPADNGGDTTSTAMQVWDDDIPTGGRVGFRRPDGAQL